MKYKLKIFIYFSLTLLIFASLSQVATAMTKSDITSIIKNTAFYDPESECSGSSGSTTTGVDELNGHKLPANEGYMGAEESVEALKARGEGLALGFGTDEENKYYITMRWRYAKWAWDGTSINGPEDSGFYLKHPRILVTNPRTKKSIIAVALEAGPAPWTGAAGDSSNPPSYWQGYIDGTPEQYTGRVAGFPPTAYKALGAVQHVYNGPKDNGDKLLYQWAKDQNAKPGPTNETAGGDTSSSSTSTSGCSSSSGSLGISPDGFVFPQKTTQKAITENKPYPWNSKTTNCYHHDYCAVDIMSQTGTINVAARGGTVNMVGDHDSSSVGSRISIKGDDGNLYYYAHMGDGTITVSNGKKIKAGTEIGKVGTNDEAMGTDPHLHMDALPLDKYEYRPACAGSDCSGLPFLNVQEACVNAFKYLPKS